jgi:hypothetical protein
MSGMLIPAAIFAAGFGFLFGFLIGADRNSLRRRLLTLAMLAGPILTATAFLASAPSDGFGDFFGWWLVLMMMLTPIMLPWALLFSIGYFWSKARWRAL